MPDRSQRWKSRAEDNVDRWGNQTAPTLFLAMVEEVGEIADALLHSSTPPDDPEREPTKVDAWSLIGSTRDLGFEVRDFLQEHFEAPAGDPVDADAREQRRQDIGGAHLSDPVGVQEEVDDLGPLLYQLTWELQKQVDNPGIWVQDATGRWHRSTTFDGYDHGLACGLTLSNTDTVADVDTDTETAPADAEDVCDPCWDYWRHGADALPGGIDR